MHTLRWRIQRVPCFAMDRLYASSTVDRGLLIKASTYHADHSGMEPTEPIIIILDCVFSLMRNLFFC